MNYALSSSPKPKMGFAGLKENWQVDLLAGFLVFLISLPLCLGVALASGFPAAAGIISAIIGGLVVSRLNGSYITVTAPAAGLIVVMLSAVETLGAGDAMAGYRYTLAAIVVASILQIILGLCKAGSLTALFPSAVVHGMLAAIGIIIITKQIHIMLGVTPENGSLFATMAQIPHSLRHANSDSAMIGFVSLALLIGWSRIKDVFWRKIPAPLLVILMGIALGHFFHLEHQHSYRLLADETYQHYHDYSKMGAKFLVNLPENLHGSFYFPDFSKTFSFDFLVAVMGICLVGSLESLLSTTAIDKLDPYKRQSDLDRDLTAVGIGNLIAGCIGGLPMIAEIVRSSTNVNNGAKTSWAGFFNGLFLLVFVGLFPRLIHSIPLAALAALLVYIGYQLASPQLFKTILSIGSEQFLLFVVTILGVLASNLLMGVLLGILVKFAIQLMRGVWFSNLFKIHFTLTETDNTIVVKLHGSALFSNFLPLKKALLQLEKGKTIVFDFSNGYLIEHTVMEFIEAFSQNYSATGGHCQQIGVPLQSFSNHKLASRIMTEDRKQG